MENLKNLIFGVAFRGELGTNNPNEESARSLLIAKFYDNNYLSTGEE